MKANLYATALFLAPLVTASAATIVTNNTGYADASIIVIDNTDTGATDNRTGTFGSDGDAITYGNDGYWSNGGNVTYDFTGLANSQEYAVYMTWYANGDTSANGVTANGTNLGTVSVTNEPNISSGFTAYDEVNDLASEFEPFQLIGTAFSTAGGNMQVILTPQGANGFGRYDAVAIALVPEPSSTALLGLGGLALILRRRKS